MRACRHVAVFLRAPRLGQVKTRLARGIGDVEALRFHRAQAQRLIRALARDQRWRVTVWLTPGSALRQRDLPFLRLARHDQGRGGLGQRMARSFRFLPPGPVLLIGADVPDLDAGVIDQAFRRLGDHDAVFGPAEDGGFWLIGLKGKLRRRPPFAGVRWSTPNALADTLAQLPRRCAAMLPKLMDIDTAEDYRRWRSRSR